MKIRAGIEPLEAHATNLALGEPAGLAGLEPEGVGDPADRKHRGQDASVVGIGSNGHPAVYRPAKAGIHPMRYYSLTEQKPRPWQSSSWQARVITGLRPAASTSSTW